MREAEQWIIHREELKVVIKLLAGETKQDQLRILKERAKLNRA